MTDKLNYKQGIIVAIITSATTIIATLISTGIFTKQATAEPATQSSVEFKDCDQQTEDLKEELGKSIKFSTLADLSNRYFDKSLQKEDIKDSIRMLVTLADQYAKEKQHYTYMLFKLRRIMLSKPRGNINTRIDNEDPEVYMLIQKLLKGIEFYDDGIDGDREKTYKAIKRFQKSVNKYSPDYFEKENYGIVGKATFSAVLDMYERE